ncbi:hypothetical protein ACFLRH_01810 [Actinomycetota bacterium]
MRGIIAVLVVATLFGASCSKDGPSEAAPEIDDSTAAQLQARAFQRACLDVICPGAPIYAPDSTPDAVRQAIVGQFTDEVQYLSDSELEQRTAADGRFSDGATMIAVEGIRSTGRDDVKSVNVGISKGYRDFTGRTYLFLWNDTQWVDTSSDAVDVTVTSSVS